MSAEVSRLLARILAGIKHGRTLPASTLGSDVEAILRMRERQSFEKDLVKRFDAVDALKSKVPKAEFEYVEDFIEEVFVHVFERTDSDDLSAYVSDDFGLLLLRCSTNGGSGGFCFSVSARGTAA